MVCIVLYKKYNNSISQKYIKSYTQKFTHFTHGRFKGRIVDELDRLYRVLSRPTVEEVSARFIEMDIDNTEQRWTVLLKLIEDSFWTPAEFAEGMYELFEKRKRQGYAHSPLEILIMLRLREFSRTK